MNRTSVPYRAERALSLLQILVLIVVLAVLAALLYPSFVGTRDEPRPPKAAQDVREIVHAVEQYAIEYGHYPQLDRTSAHLRDTPDEGAGDSAAGMKIRNAALFNTLRDIDQLPNDQHRQNPRHVVFVQGKTVSNRMAPKDGFLEEAGDTGSQGSWYDQWGSEYNIVIDSNLDETLDVGRFYEDLKGSAAPREKVGAFSLGKDTKLGKGGVKRYKNGVDYSDDLVSWATH